MFIGIITLFPEMFKAITEFGVTGRAVKHNLLQVRCYNPRDFTHDKHKTVDDRPYGGGPGMLMMVQPLRDAIHSAKADAGEGVKVIYLSPQGRKLEQAGVKELSLNSKMILVCGRYEGIDERLIQSEIDEEWFADGLLDCPHYTRPEVLDGLTVPPVLMSGNHAEICKWRLKQSLERTWLRRPELLESLALTDEQRKLLQLVQAEHNS